jgi:hypothetical protein
MSGWPSETTHPWQELKGDEANETKKKAAAATTAAARASDSDHDHGVSFDNGVTAAVHYDSAGGIPTELEMGPLGTHATGPGAESRAAPFGSVSDGADAAGVDSGAVETGGTAAGAQYRVYKRRWFGLVQLTLLNIVVSWDVSVFFFPLFVTDGLFAWFIPASAGDYSLKDHTLLIPSALRSGGAQSAPQSCPSIGQLLLSKPISWPAWSV